MSFAECTATSIRPSRSASSSSLTNTPRAPISPNGRVRSRSPAVVIGTSAISTPERRSRVAASSACVSASLLPREPMRISTAPGALHSRLAAEPSATDGVVQLRAVELGCPDLLGTRPQRRDRRDDVERGLPGAKAVRLLRDDFFRSFGLATPIGERLGNDGLEIVDVVEIATVELVD